MSFRQTSGLLAAVARRWGERRGALAARPHICPRSTGWVPATPTETGLTFSSPHHLFITMGPPVVPTPLCSSPLTRSLVLVLCLSVAPRSSSLCYLGFFFSLSLQKSLYKIVLFTFCKFQNPLVAVKPQDFEEATERGRRSSAEEIKVSDFCGSEEVFFRRTLCESASAHHQLGIPPVPLVCFQTRFSPHCW